MDVVAREKMNTLLRTPPVNIEFEDIRYSVPGMESKNILKSINGKFCSGELTAIIGPSGSGKTTLLNILAGYIMNGVTGSIMINDKPRQMNFFNKISTYIMQEDLLQPHLTTHESVMVAARLKLEDNINLERKQAVAEHILSILGLQNCVHTMVENISGGERKRLSIALEMVSNPPVIFLDEPTSGLDSVSIRQCVDALRTLTNQRKTVICTIHQPSMATFQQCDQVFFIADGMCAYNGSPSQLIPFLTSIGLECPITYSSTDYVIETVQINPEHATLLVTAIENGKKNIRDMRNSPDITSYDESSELLDAANVNFVVSFWTQFYVLFGRMMLQMRRNKLALLIQLLYHILVGVLCGVLFLGIGNDGGQAYANLKLCLVVMVFFIYNHLQSPILLFPFEVKIVKREYFNRWYGLKAYYVALTLRSLPILIILGLIFLTIIYLLTNQPMELNRFIWFALASILVAVTSEGLGLAVGSIFSVTNGSIIGPAIAAICICLCLYGVGYATAVHPFMKLLLSISFMRYAWVALALALFENRGQFECDDDRTYPCFYRDPKHLLIDMGMHDSSYFLQMLGLSVFLLLFRLIAFLALRYRLKADRSYTTKILLAK